MRRKYTERPLRTSFLLSCSLVIFLCAFVQVGKTVKREDWKTCQQSGFCRRNRDLADKAEAAGTAWASPYELDAGTLTLEKGQLKGTILKSTESGEKVELPLVFTFLENGVARLQIDEARRAKGDIELRGNSKARKGRYDQASKWALVGDLTPNEGAILEKEEGVTKILYGPFEAVIQHKPFAVRFLRDGEIHVVFNERSLMNIEHWRPQPEKKDPEEEVNDRGEWDEVFRGTTDSKPRGPESVALDISFPGYPFVYGIPEHATNLALRPTRGGEGNYGEPYRLYNGDVFEYDVDSPMTLYGSIPFMQAQKKGSTVGVFWLNSAETWIDVVKQHTNPLSFGNQPSTQTHWMSESGIIDVFVLLGPNASWLYKQYGELTGYTSLPQMFAIGYHQCRWNYVSQADVKAVDKKFDKFDMPYDVIWLDIEYTDSKKYFTWDPLTFNNPNSMLKTLDRRRRKLVAIIDPHIKKDDGYAVYKELSKQSLVVKDKNGNDFEGQCWPGASVWVDYSNPLAQEFWKQQFSFDKFKGTADNVHIWNDMNEPSVFSGPEITMPKDNLHHDGWEHRDIHNLYGMTMHNATYYGLLSRLPKGKRQRPFVLTRAFFAGSQRTAAMWTGDNEAKWNHLQAAFPMLMSQGIAGMPFAGADVGGFFGNPSKELLTRWYQAGAFYPFFRAHAHIDSRRREPYLVGEPYVSIIRDAIRLRYQLLPAWYTAFHRASWEGMPILRPMFVMFPENEAGFGIDDQFFMGDTGLLVKPVVHEGSESVRIWLPDDQFYYDYFDYTIYKGEGHHEIKAPLEKVPILMRGGHIIPRRDRPRRSSALMKYDPFTLVVNVGKDGVAGGVLYLDDGETFNYEKGEFIHRSFVFSMQDKTLRSSNYHPDPTRATNFLKAMEGVRVEKVIFVGLNKEAIGATRKAVEVKCGKKTWKAKITVKEGDQKALVITVRDPKVDIGQDWTIAFT